MSYHRKSIMALKQTTINNLNARAQNALHALDEAAHQLASIRNVLHEDEDTPPRFEQEAERLADKAHEFRIEMMDFVPQLERYGVGMRMIPNG